jgi:hypothetical protein
MTVASSTTTHLARVLPDSEQITNTSKISAHIFSLVLWVNISLTVHSQNEYFFLLLTNPHKLLTYEFYNYFDIFHF